MDCKKLARIFDKCKSPHYAFPKNAQEVIANEAQTYNCILLSNTLRKQCDEYKKKDLSLQDMTVYDEK
jgi:hypothetical protein